MRKSILGMVILAIFSTSYLFSMDKYYDVSVVLKIRFETGGIKINKDDQPILENLNQLMTDFPEAFIYIVGHTDSIGSSMHNLELSRKRAGFINNFLVSRGASSDRIEFNGRGEAAPIEPNASKEGRLRNRRVVITFSNLSKDRTDNLTSRLSVMKGIEVIKERRNVVVSNTDNQVVGNINGGRSLELKKLDSLWVELGSFHTELASEVTSGPSQGQLSDEVLSNVRLSANLIQYNYHLSKNQYLAPLLRLRWYSFSKEISNFLQDDYEALGWSVGLGYGHYITSRFRVQANLVFEKQLYYFARISGQQWTIDLESSIRPEVQTFYKVYEGKKIDIELGVQLAYLLNLGDLDSGFNYGVRMQIPFSLPIGSPKSWYISTGYQVNKFDLNNSNIKHEILELGLGYKIKFF